MLYEQYAKKIRRYADVRDSVLRFKIPIICAISAILLMWAGFLATKGMITEQVTGNEQYTYGDSMSFGAKALFSDIALEYSADGGESWSEAQPTLPGEYLVRAVSEQSFGRNNHSDAFAFSILPKSATLCVKESTVEWRVSPSVEAKGLLGTDRLQSADVNMGADTIGSVDAVADTSSAVILNSAGEDVTSAYTLTAETKSVTVTPRYLTVKAKDVSREYNGEALLPVGYDVLVGSVIDGHNVDVDFKPYELINIGHESIVIDKISITENGSDVTANYSIALRDGSATVTKRVISVASDGAVKQFDGKKLEIPEYRVEGSTVGTDKLTVTTCNEEFFAPMSAGKPHITSVTVTDPVTGEDRSSNYDIRIVAGTLQIIRRAITVETPIQTKTYDGSPLSSDGAYTLVGELAAGHEIVVDKSSIVSITDPGKAMNTLSYRIMFNGADLTDYYSITNVNGMLTVNKIAITVKTESISGVYNNKPYTTNGEYSISGGAILDSHKLVVLSYNEITDPGTGNNTLTFVIVPRSLSSNDTDFLIANDLSSKFYTITNDFGTIAVRLRPITISTGSMSETYNGKSQYCKEFTVSQDNGNEEGLLSVHTVQMSGWIGQKDQNEDSPTQNFAVYTLYDKYGTELNIHKYYTVTEVWGTLTVTKRDITIVTGSSDPNDPHEFDGYSEICTDVYDKNGSLVSGHVLEVLTVTKLYEAGSVPNVLDVAIVNRSTGTDLSNNYNITYEYGTLTVTRRIIEITFTDITQMYNAEPVDFSKYYSYNQYVVQSSYLTHYMEVRIDKEYRNVADSGTYTIGLEIWGTDIDKYIDSYDMRLIHVDADGTRTQRNTATVTITPIPLTVYVNDTEKFYDGQYAVADYTEDQKNKALYPDGHYLSVVMNERYINASESAYRYTVSCYVYSHYYSELEYSNNYDITVVYTGKENGNGYSLYTIKHRPINVTNDIYERSWEYNGSEHFLTSLTLTPADVSLKDALSPGHYIFITDYPTITNVGIKDNIIEFDIRDLQGNSVRSNYAINEDWGTIEITPRPIIVVTGTERKEYDGEILEHRYVSTLWKGNEYVEGLISDLHEITLDPEVISQIGPDVLYDETGIKVIGKDNILKVLDIICNTDGNVESVLYNYSIEYRYGTITIDPRTITVTTGSATMEYNGVDTLTENSFTYEGLILDHVFNEDAIQVTGSRMRVGVTRNYGRKLPTVTSFVTSADGNTDLSGNYRVNFSYGNLEVTPIMLKLQPNYVFGEYNGNEWTVTSGRCTTKKKLLDNGTDAVLYIRATGSAINAGVEKSRIMTAVVRDAYGIGVYSNWKLEYYRFQNSTMPMYINVEEGTLIIYSDGTVTLSASLLPDSNYVRESAYGCSYDFELIEGEINISKRRVYISAPAIANYTFGMSLPESWISQGTMASGHYLFAPTYVTTKDGVLVTTVEPRTIMIYADPKFETAPITGDVIDNYEFIIKDGEVT